MRGGWRAVLLLALVAAAGCGGRAPVAIPACAGDDLEGSFDVVRGSAGAGNVVYRLTLRDASDGRCSLGGLPRVRLLAADGSPLPTRVRPSGRSTGAPAKIVLRRDEAAVAEARFSPDVPGVGDAQGRRCQPVASKLRVQAPGGSAVTVAIRPPTSVCERGSLAFDPLSRR